jgi:hypothetical protein
MGWAAHPARTVKYFAQKILAAKPEGRLHLASMEVSFPKVVLNEYDAKSWMILTVEGLWTRCSDFL